MITLYTGTPGSGKSLHAAEVIISRLRRGGGLICNFPVELSVVKKVKARYSYWDNSEITPTALREYAWQYHRVGKEGQTLLVVDEAQVIWNCRDFGVKNRMPWIEFFTQHRKLGYNVILITQHDRMLDRQIRALVEYECKHRKVNNYGFIGMLLSFTFTSWFLGIDRWYGMQGKDAVVGRSFFRYKRKLGRLYDSYMLFDAPGVGKAVASSAVPPAACSAPPAGGGVGTACGGALPPAGGASQPAGEVTTAGA